MKGLWITLTTIIVVVGGFFGISWGMAKHDNHSITDEWRSWLPAQEETVETPSEETEENDEIVVETESEETEAVA